MIAGKEPADRYGEAGLGAGTGLRGFRSVSINLESSFQVYAKTTSDEIYAEASDKARIGAYAAVRPDEGGAAIPHCPLLSFHRDSLHRRYYRGVKRVE
jgi:hypothetical protein